MIEGALLISLSLREARRYSCHRSCSKLNEQLLEEVGLPVYGEFSKDCGGCVWLNAPKPQRGVGGLGGYMNCPVRPPALPPPSRPGEPEPLLSKGGRQAQMSSKYNAEVQELYIRPTRVHSSVEIDCRLDMLIAHRNVRRMRRLARTNPFLSEASVRSSTVMAVSRLCSRGTGSSPCRTCSVCPWPFFPLFLRAGSPKIIQTGKPLTT